MSFLFSPNSIPFLPADLFRPTDGELSREKRSLIQAYRLLSVLGALLILLFFVPYSIDRSAAIDPLWARIVVAGYFVGLFFISYGSTSVRRHYLSWGRGGAFLVIGWYVTLTTVNHFDGDYGIGLLFLYAVLPFVVGLGARSVRPVVWFLAAGFLLMAAGVVVAEDLQTSPLVVLSSAATVALVEVIIMKSQITAHERIRDREARLYGLANSLPGAVYQFTARPGEPYDVYFVSSDAEDLLGISATPDGFFDRFVDCIPQAHCPVFLDSIEEAVEKEAHWQTEIPFVKPSGERIWLMGTSMPERGEGEEEVVFNGVLLDITERKEWERDLRETTEQLNSIIEASPDAIFTLDLDGTVRLWNPAAERIFGWSTEEVIGEPLPFIPDEKVKEFEWLRNRVAGGESFSGVELKRQRKDGTLIDVDLSTAPLRDEKGEVVGIMATIEDVTEEKERKRELRERGRQLEQIRENVTDVVWISSPDKQEMEFVSTAYEDVWGRSTAALKENPGSFVEGIHPEDLERVRMALKLQKGDPDAYEETYRVIQPDGEVRWVQDRASGIRDDEGRLQRIAGVATDITDQKRAENELRETKQLFEKTVESLSEAVFVVDPSSREIVTCNAAVETVFGYKKEELIGGSTKVLHVDREAYTRFGEISEQALETEGVYTGEYRMCRKDGQVIYTEHTVTPLRGDEWPDRVVSVIRDISERKEQEQSLREERDLLQRVIQTSPTAVAIFNREGDFVRVSDRCQDILGLEKSEVTGRTYNDPEWHITAPDGGPMPDEELPFARVIATRESVYDVEHAIEWPDGRRCLLSVSGAPLFDADDTLEGAVFHMDDITEQREQQRTLQDRERKTAALYNATQQLVKAECPEDVAVQIEELVRTTFNYSLNGVHFLQDGHLVPVHVSPDIADRWPDMPARDVEGTGLGARALRAGESVVAENLQDIETDLKYADLRSGACVPIGGHGVIAVASSEADGIDSFDVQLMEILATDAAVVLDRIEREDELRLFRKMVEHAHDAILLSKTGPLDRSEIVYVNPSFTDMTGYGLEEAVGGTTEILRGPDTQLWIVEQMQEEVRRGTSAEGETIHYRKDGTPFVNHWNVAPVRDDDGEITHLVSVQRDVTEKRRMQERLLEVQEEERRRIDQEIHDEMGGLFASLQMTVDLARFESKDAGALTDHLDQIESFVSDLSTAARTISRKLYPRALSKYGLASALPSLVDEINAEHGLDVHLHSEVEPEDRFSSLVERTAFWVIQEALVNVARHAETNTAQVVVNRSEHKLRIHVIDEGVGFDPASIDEEESYGLRGITERVERLNGDLNVDARTDEGTRISATLPLTISSLSE